MLFVTHKHNKALVSSFHIGEKIYGIDPQEVVEVQADGDELFHIVRTFHNFPYTETQVQRWYGDQAKFIVGNW